MEHVRLRHGAPQDVQHRQEHGADGPEHLVEGRQPVGILTGPHHHVQKGVAGQKLVGAVGPALPEHGKQQIPVRLVFCDQVHQGLPLLILQAVRGAVPGFLIPVLVQKILVDLHQVLRQLVLELAPLPLLGANGVQHELVLGHALHEHLHSRGHPARHIGVAALGDQADLHALTPSGKRKIPAAGSPPGTSSPHSRRTPGRSGRSRCPPGDLCPCAGSSRRTR